MKFSILEFSNDNVSGMGCSINFVFDSVCLLSAVCEPHRLPMLVALLVDQELVCVRICVRPRPVNKRVY